MMPMKSAAVAFTEALAYGTASCGGSRSLQAAAADR